MCALPRLPGIGAISRGAVIGRARSAGGCTDRVEFCVVDRELQLDLVAHAPEGIGVGEPVASRSATLAAASCSARDFSS